MAATIFFSVSQPCGTVRLLATCEILLCETLLDVSLMQQDIALPKQFMPNSYLDCTC